MKNKKLFAILTLVCFMFTLMPVAAFAATTASDSTSYVYTDDTQLAAGEKAEMKLDMFTQYGGQNANIEDMYVWVTKVGSDVAVDSVKVYGKDGKTLMSATQNVWNTKAGYTNENSFYVEFFVQGDYKVHVSATTPGFENGKIAAATEFDNTEAVIAVDPVLGSSKDYAAVVTFPDDSAYTMLDEDGDKVATGKVTISEEKVKDKDIYKEENGQLVYVGSTYETVAESEKLTYDAKASQIVKDEYTLETLAIRATGVEEKTVSIKLLNNVDDKDYVAGATLTIDAIGVEVDKDSVTTDRRGNASFKVSGEYEGTYPIYVSCGQFDFTIMVQVGSTAAYEIKATKEPSAPQDILGAKSLEGIVTFAMYDVNGNKVDAQAKVADVQGWYKAANSNNAKLEFPVGSRQTVDATGYAAIVEQPAGSELTNKDVTFDGSTINLAKPIKVEGDYTFKVTLDNGASATVKVTVKEFTKPEKLVLAYPATVELGATVGHTTLKWVDVNGVEKSAAGKVDLAATGYAVANYNAKTGILNVKSDEKYIGATITITAVDSRNNLTATTTVTVADDAKELVFAADKAVVDVNNTIKVNVVDAQGNNVALGSANAQQDARATISYVVLDKPENAKVHISTDDQTRLGTQGYFTMDLTCDTVGNVVVQAVLKYEYKDVVTQNQVTKYYTGTEVIGVGTTGESKVVVMSIGSTEIVINDEVSDMGVAPVIENGRTFVPYRAGLEALGATVAYDEATQAVTAEMNGVTVVMTIGSNVYTINGVEHTMDVAPFISESRTMVPARFAAQAFGITVIPTQNPDGTTADVLYVM